MIQVFNNVGHVGRLEEKTSDKGNPYVVFSLAVRIGYGDKEKTLWYKCLVMEPRLVERFKKAKVKVGSYIQVVGEQDKEEFVRKDGTPGTADTVFLYAFGYVYSGKKQENGGTAATSSSGNTPAQTPAAGNSSGFDEMEIGEDDGDLPF